MDGNIYLMTAVATERINSRVRKAQSQRRVAKARRRWSARPATARADY